MRILICGAGGFIGRSLAQHLAAAGHSIVRGVRRPQHPDERRFDFTAPDHAAWTSQLDDIDAVVNCVGILVESAGARFDDIHRRGPQALFAACVAAGIRRIVQVSALGAERADTPYLASKKAADEALMHLPLDWQIVRPSLVYGTAGQSAAFFRQLASLPLIPLPAGGRQALRPIHIDDLCATIARLLDPAEPTRQCLALVGPEETTWQGMLRTYRQAMGFPPAHWIALPARLMQPVAWLAGHIPGSPLTPDTWKMLQAGSSASPDPLPARGIQAFRAPAQFIAPGEARALRQQALAAWRTPLLRGSLASVWLITAWISLFVHPLDDSLRLLARTGLHGDAARLALIGAAGIDLLFGWMTLARPGRRLWLGQIALIAGYSLVIAGCLPEFLTHPFGPIVKNLPILALLTILLSEEENP